MFGGIVTASRSWRVGGRGAAGALALAGALGVAVTDGVAVRAGDVGWNRHLAPKVAVFGAADGDGGGAVGRAAVNTAGHGLAAGYTAHWFEGGAVRAVPAGDVGWNSAGAIVPAGDVGWNRGGAIVPAGDVGWNSSGHIAPAGDVGWNRVGRILADDTGRSTARV